jgi:hypothetical protein
MVVGALEEWSSRACVPSKKLLDAMMSRAFTNARRLVESGRAETCAGTFEYPTASAAADTTSTMRASSIIESGKIRDPEANERIRGECFGALLQRVGAMSWTREFHEEIRNGCRDQADAPALTPAQEGRSWVDRKNLYYRISDLLQQDIPFRAAARIFNLSESQASKMARDGTLPFRVRWIGNSRSASVRSIMLLLEISDSIVHPDDVENGAAHASGAEKMY